MTSTREEKIQRLILGTAQFGLNYGISNKHGQITQSEINAILNKASQASITTLDTAAVYGDSEDRIGTSYRETKYNFQIISKYPPNSAKSITECFQTSLNRLKVDRLHAYLLHSFSTYSNNPAIIAELKQLKDAGKVDKIGISLYHPEEALELIDHKVKLDVVQFPYSVFDRRFEAVLPLLRQRGVETHARSIYLQGLYFIAPEQLPANFSTVSSKIASLQQLASHNNIPLAAMLLGFALSNCNITNIVVGVESLKTLKENIDFCGTIINEQVMQQLHLFQEDNENIILPYNW